MKRILAALALALAAATSFGATTYPLSLLSPTGSSSGQFVTSTGATTAPVWSTVNLATLGGLSSATAASTYATIAQATTALAATGGSINGVAVSATTLKASSNVKLQYRNTSGQSIAASTATTVTGWTSVFDANSNFAPSTGVFTAPVTGYYLIAVQMTINLTGTIAAANQMVVSVLGNGSTVASCTNSVFGTAQQIIQQTCTAVVSLAATQTAAIQITQATGNAQTLNIGAVANTLNIVQIP